MEFTKEEKMDLIQEQKLEMLQIIEESKQKLEKLQSLSHLEDLWVIKIGRGFLKCKIRGTKVLPDARLVMAGSATLMIKEQAQAVASQIHNKVAEAIPVQEAIEFSIVQHQKMVEILTK